MGAGASKGDDQFAGELVGRRKGVATPLRYQGVTDGGKKGRGLVLPPGATKSTPEDWPFIESCLAKLVLASKLDGGAQRAIAGEMYEVRVAAGNILIKEGDQGLAASELYIVKSGEFEVLEQRQGISMRVNRKKRGDIFGEAALLFNNPRSATVAATTDAVVWALHRTTFRHFIQQRQETEATQVEVFLNSVPLLDSLALEEKQRLAEAFEEVSYPAGYLVIQQGQPGDKFYIVTEGEAAVSVEDGQGGSRKVNHLFRADFFGEKALLTDEPRGASVEVVKPMRCLVLRRSVFQELLGPLEELMRREKSPAVVTSRMSELQVTRSAQSAPAEVLIKRARRSKGGGEAWDVVRARGHLPEVLALRADGAQEGGAAPLVLVEGAVLGGGAFSRVSRVTEESTGREYALKRMRKTAVVQCPEHVFCEQAITKNVVHPFCIRQYASFQDKYHLYFLFDLMSGGDLMDVLVSEAHVVRMRLGRGTWRRGCFAPKVKMLKGMDEGLARFYTASIVLALEHLHESRTVYRDLKPENVFVDQEGFVKLGDFGFAKVLASARRTYTFCGTPGYVAPENVLAHGYNYSVDWWGLGVLLYVLLTGRQPFSSPKTDDPMVIMRRIVDEAWAIKYPPYVSPAAKDLVGRFLERKPARRLGMLSGRAGDVKAHRWFDGLDWEALAARRLAAPRRPKADSAKRIKDLAETDRKGRRPKESAEELQECQTVFQNF